MDAIALDARRERGRVIATTLTAAFRQITGDIYFVPSQTRPGSGYVVDAAAGRCSCPDHEANVGNTNGTANVCHFICKHRAALHYFRREWTLPDGGSVVTETARLTYPQNWPAYQAAQCEEIDRATILARSLCNGIQTPPQTGRGRRCLPLGDVVFCTIMRAYRCLSSRRSMSDIRALAARGFIRNAPSFTSMIRTLERDDLTPLYRRLLSESARPLAAIERRFAADSTGFSTQTWGTASWFEFKHQNDQRVRDWFKFHGFIGCDTNAIVDGVVTGRDAGDSPEFRGLVERTIASGFRMEEAYADKAYLSHENLGVLNRVGGTLYVPFKPNNRGDTGDDTWDRLHHLYSFNRPAFNAHYNKRQNVEATFSGLKRKFGDTLRCRNVPAMTNEVYVRATCWNLSVLVHSIHELNIDPQFWMPPAAQDGAA
jgi:transposase